MTDEEIIAEARIKYPANCHVNSTGGSQNELVTFEGLVNLYWDGNQLRTHSNCSLYHKRDMIWAKIVKMPEPTIINDYPIF